MKQETEKQEFDCVAPVSWFRVPLFPWGRAEASYPSITAIASI